ncbi:Hypothetical protein, putative [Bodo saltans]|uniref:Uncharacterized protein n=1 Tax=Bodo saltans TaxID=75058 RepID=A0A0S4JBG5_BODSA|nr:Hypothetical protein, putative [Bodo saltans]|eukprot:CUG87528.1 Hypothetical protein, putative [Bodo saltans]
MLHRSSGRNGGVALAPPPVKPSAKTSGNVDSEKEGNNREVTPPPQPPTMCHALSGRVGFSVVPPPPPPPQDVSVL